MLTWFAQELDSSCVAACVRMALNGLGDGRDEAQVRQLIGYTRLVVSLAAAQTQIVELALAPGKLFQSDEASRISMPTRIFS